MNRTGYIHINTTLASKQWCYDERSLPTHMHLDTNMLVINDVMCKVCK